LSISGHSGLSEEFSNLVLVLIYELDGLHDLVHFIKLPLKFRIAFAEVIDDTDEVTQEK
jgi:hypothetical protein